MSALPHIGQTIRNRRDLRVLTGAASYAAHQRYTDPSLDWEMQRAARTELLPMQPEPVMFCAVADDDESELSMVALIAACLAGMGLWAAVGYATWWVVGLIFGAHA